MNEVFAMDYAGRIAYSSLETLRFTRDAAFAQSLLEGDFVECGVAAGAQIIAMRCGAPKKVIHAFDSFEGIPLPSNRDDQMPGLRLLTPEEIKTLPEPGKQKLETTGATSVSVADFMNHLVSAGIDAEQGIVIHAGWFEETVPKNEIAEIALLRLDGDLYNSTIVCLKHLFPKVIKGGLIIIDDYELPGCRAACEDYFKGCNPKFQTVSNTRYFIK